MSRFLSFTEQIFQNIKQEYSRYQRRRQLEGAFNQSEGCGPSDSQSSALTSPNSPPVKSEGKADGRGPIEAWSHGNQLSCVNHSSLAPNPPTPEMASGLSLYHCNVL
ncbi:hypothetical protein JZ751_029713 [Albula glossodonta]|uniref:Akirin 1 n=1 Tax=Albula glossodonta TaxID=121402 RepID=A0A8T2NHI0_9TELE|nr:hypothetical protein JZ751_029713 [Albula glossodonta]